MFRFPDLCGEQFGVLVLDCASGIGGNSFTASTRPMDQKFVKLTGIQLFGGEA